MNHKTECNPIAAKDLFEMAISEHVIYSRCTVFIIANLRRKFLQGIYDKEKAVKAYEVAATRMAKLYAHRRATYEPVKYYHFFNAATRYESARMLEEYYYDEIVEE